MRSAVRKWGNSLAIRIPRAVAEEAAMTDGTEVDVFIKDGQVVVTPASPPPSLQQLVDAIRPGNVHQEASPGTARGREAW